MTMNSSNRKTACVAFMVMICAVPIIVSGSWFASAPGEACARLPRWPVPTLGVLILLVALVGLVGAYKEYSLIVGAYLAAMAALIGLLIALIVFGFAVTGGSGAYPVLGRAYDEYRLDGFSRWLRAYVSDDPWRWERIASCLSDTDTCKKLARQATFLTADQFYMSTLTPVQSGCCKPPSDCGFNYTGPTVWAKPAQPTANPDCGLWSNDPGQLCYQCDSCRAGLLGTLRSEWHKANIALVVATAALLILYTLAWIAYRSSDK